MGRRDTRHDRAHGDRRWTLVLPVVLVVAVLAAAAASYRFDLGERWFGIGGPDPDTDPAAVAPPSGLALPALTTPDPIADEAAGAVDPRKVRRALTPLLDDRDLGRDVFAAVAGLDGRPVFDSGRGTAIPASTLKLLTSAAALETLGPDHTFATTVVSAGPKRIVLVGGGDPYLAGKPADEPATYPHRADVVTLARATAKELKAAGRSRVRLGYDTSLFSGPSVSPHWPKTYVPDGVVSPITALWVDEGRSASGFGRVPDPAATAAATFAGALARAGIEVVGIPEPRTAPRDATELARVTSAPLAQIVERTLEVSDNEAAEVIARHVGLATGGSGSFTDGAGGVLRVLRGLGVSTEGAETYDGSGLSRDDRLDPDTLTAVLAVAADHRHPELRPVLTGLPVAGFTGSLDDRFALSSAAGGAGFVRAKTGTLSGVSSLAGTVTDRQGNPMVFAVMADRIRLRDTLDARAALEALASALADCRCGR